MGFSSTESEKECGLYHHPHKEYPEAKFASGNFIFTVDGRKVFDAASGAGVVCIGYNNERVNNAVSSQMRSGISYLASAKWTHKLNKDLCKVLSDGTNGELPRIYLSGGGSEGVEAAMKLARQFFHEMDTHSPRVKFIARHQSYHGNTIGALSLSGHQARRLPYEPFLMGAVHHISPCYAYRQREDGQSDTDFVLAKAAELDAKFQEVGPETVIGFIAEPIVGAALGCVPCVPGYLEAMRAVCHKHGALFMLDEVMCGMGRTGTLHAWQAEGIAPDIQIVGKGLAGGYQSLSAVLASERVAKMIWHGGQFIHGLTFDCMPTRAAAALEVQEIIREENLLENVKRQGAYLEKRLKAALGDHPNVGDIRGRGLFWGLEFVKDKSTKETFDPELALADSICKFAFSPPFNMAIYPGTGTVDGVRGDHIMIVPPYNISEKDVDDIVSVIKAVVEKAFLQIMQ